MKTKRVLVVVHEDYLPTDDPTDETQRASVDAAMHAEIDVLTALRELGHEVHCVGVRDEIGPLLAAVDAFSPHIVFNLLEEFGGRATLDQNVVSFLEILRLRYTGNGPKALTLARDKALAKKVMVFHGIPTPAFLVVEATKPHEGELPPGPWIVKSLTEDASLGISARSVVKTEKALWSRVDYIHQQLGTAALVEKYIPGREFYVGVIGNRQLEPLPIWEMLWSKSPSGAPQIATARAKWDEGYRQAYGISSGPARDLSPAATREIQDLALRAYRQLEMSGYARLDFRMTDDGQVFLLEANPNPDISSDSDFALAAAAAGLSYPELLNQIIALGLRRPQAA